MRKNLRASVALTLIAVIGIGSVASLGSDRQPVPSEKRRTSSDFAANRREAAKSSKPIATKLLARRPQNREGGLAGQSVTELADGRRLKTGGYGDDGPKNEAVIEGEGSSHTAGLNYRRAWHTATLLPDGNVLILGGVGSDGEAVRIAEVFNIETHQSEALADSALRARVYHTATLMTTGEVLIAGGLSSDGKALKTAEVWDYRTRSARRIKSKLATARYNHTATLMASGDALLRGGTDNEGKAINQDEAYRVEEGRFRAWKDSAESEEEMPRVAGSVPRDGADNVAWDALLALRFTKPMRVSTLNRENVTLSGPYGAVESRVVGAEGGRLVFITPDAPLFPGYTYTVTIAGAQDETGAEIETSTMRFTTAGEIIRPGDSDDEEWIPDRRNLSGDWNSHRADSPWRSLPALEAPRGVTALSGQVLRLNGKPLADVTLRIGELSSRTDKTGRFLLAGIASGRSLMIIDGSTANRAGKTYCLFDVSVEAVEGKTTALDYTIWLPLEDTRHATRLDVPTKKAVVATTPRIPGLEVHIPEGVILRTRHGHPLTSLSLTPVPVDRPPFPLPEGTQLFFTPQVHGAKVESVNGDPDAGVRIIFPNTGRLAAGSRVELMTYEAGYKGWHVYGQGTVTADGRQIVPDADVVIKQFMCLHIVGPESDAPPEGPPPCDCSAYVSDPVHLGTGLFVMNQTDLVLPDVIPISLTRTYRQRDTKSRPFGIGSTHPYQMILVGPGAPYSQIDLLLPDGGRVRFNRISAGTGYTDAVLEHTSSPSSFYKATLRWDAVLFGWEMKFRDGSVWEFKAFGNNQGPPTLGGIIDRNGNKLTISHTTGRKIDRITSANQRWMEFSYDASNRITEVTDNMGRTVSYTYDTSGRLWKVTDPVGGVTEYSYDTSHRMLTIKDARGIVYLTNDYDTNGRVIKQTQADAGFYQFAYTLDGNGKVTQAVVTDSRGHTRTMTFNASGYSLTDTESCCGGGLSQTVEREAGTNRILSVTDSAGRRTEYSYNSMGNVTSVTALAGTSEAVTTSLTYEPVSNKVASMTDPLNHTATFGYDSKGNLISVSDALNHQAIFTYNSAGQMTTLTDPLGNTTQYIYEGSDLVKVINPLGQSASRFIDAAGRLLSATNALGQTTRYEYNAFNRVTKVIDPIQGMTQFAYDANANLLSVTDARGKVTSYTYNNMDRVATQTDPLTHQESYQYDLNGNLTQTTDRKNQVTNYSYDSLDRVSLVTYHDSSTISYAYDSVSRLSQVTDSVSGVISYTYDNLNRTLSETTPQGVASYGYDAASRMTSMTVGGQTAVSYSYDNANRLTQITQDTSVVSFTYDNADRRTTMTLPNGVVSEYGYDAASRLTGITYKKGAVTLGNLSYEYDASGRRVKMGGSFARINLPSAVNTTTYDDANRQTGFGSQTLAYDNNGNLTSDGVNTYTWNARDQLASISGSGLSASFQYDAFGRRISKTVNSASVSFLYDGANIVQEKVGSTVSANLLAGGIDEIFTRSDTSGTSSFVKDALGSTLALTDSSGVIQTEHTYEPFGKTTTSGTSSNNTSKYTGREDDSTGLYYYRARYYSPSLQRFISEDPIGFRGGDFNLYAYVSNNPVMKTDPTGKEQFTYRQDGSIVFPTYATGGRDNCGEGMGGVWAMAGCIAIAEPTPVGEVVLGLAIACAAICVAIAGNPPKDGGGKVIPFPGPKDKPVPPPPPLGGGGGGSECWEAYLRCMTANLKDAEHLERCRQAYLNCQLGLPTIFPGGECVK